MPASASARQHEHAACPWFRKPTIQQVVREELRQCSSELEGAYGRRGLLLRGCEPLPDNLPGHRLHTLHHAWMGPPGVRGPFKAAESRLPLCSEGLSLVFMLHALEFSRAPAALLGECARVLESEGLLMVLVLNPLSPFRLRWWGRDLDAFTALRTARLLRCAGLEVHACRQVGVWWRARDALTDPVRARWLGLRSSTLLLARKRESGMTPLRLQRRPVPLGARTSPG